MRAVAECVSEEWQVGETIRVMDGSLEFSLDVIIQVVFGVQQADRVDEFKRSIKRYVKSFRPAFAFSKLMQKRIFPSWNRFLKEKAALNKLLDEQIDLCRDLPADPAKHGFLSMLINAQDESGPPLSGGELKDQLITLLFAGHETTQIAIGWAMSWLHRCNPVLERLRSELECNDLPAMVQSDYLHGVCCEALRLNPIVADFLRVLEKPAEFEEVDLPRQILRLEF